MNVEEKQVVSAFMNRMCGVDVDVSSAPGQCECLLGLIVV